MGAIPEIQDWTIQMNYQKEIEDVKNLKNIEIEQSDIDVAKLQGRDIEKMKKERLEIEKNKKITEINKKYGIEIEKDTGTPENVEKLQIPPEREKLWNILQGRGLIKEKK
jgi:hypothetical protein